MATLEENLLYPLILLLVGAGVSGVLVSWLTNRWQDRRRQRDIEIEDLRKEREIKVEDHRKKLEIKVDITSKMAEVICYQLANAFTAFDRQKSTFSAPERDAYYEDLKKWYIDVSIISSKLESYFSETDIKTRWERFYYMLLAFNSATRQLFLEAPSERQKDALQYNLENIKDYFSDVKEINWDVHLKEMASNDKVWYKISELIYNEGEKIIKDVLTTLIKVF